MDNSSGGMPVGGDVRVRFFVLLAVYLALESYRLVTGEYPFQQGGGANIPNNIKDSVTKGYNNEKMKAYENLKAAHAELKRECDAKGETCPELPPPPQSGGRRKGSRKGSRKASRKNRK